MAGTNGASVTGSHASLAGAVLAAIRAHIGYTQQDLAEAMGRDSKATVQAWETGRRPMLKLPWREVARLQRVLTLAGADSTHVATLTEALTADHILAELDTTDVPMHPLTGLVPTRSLTELLAWPFTDKPPRQLTDLAPVLHTSPAWRDELAGQLRRAAEFAGRDLAGSMLRRQVHYLTAAHPPSAGWLHASEATEARALPDLREWSPQWPLARSQAIVAAASGDHEPMARFIERGLSTDEAMAANIRYWAYWVGEIAQPWTTDADMVDSRQPFTGELLLPSLLDGLTSAPYRELCAHALHGLVRMRGQLGQAHAGRIITAIDYATSTHDLTDHTRQRLEQVAYRLRT